MVKRKGPLETPVERRRLPLLASKDVQMQVIREWMAEDDKKLNLLCDEMGIVDGPTRFYDLSLGLARKFIPGFQQRKSHGKWNDLTRSYLVVEIERLTADRKRGHNTTWAAKSLAKRPVWGTFLGGEGLDHGEALRKQYQGFKHDKIPRLFRDAFKWHEHEGTVDEWNVCLQEALTDPHGYNYL